MKKSVLCLVILCCFLFVYSQTDTSNFEVDSTTLTAEDLEVDTSAPAAFTQPVLRRISDDSMRALKQDEAFSYMKYIDSFFRHHEYPKEKITRQQEEIEKPGLFANPGLRMLYWLVAFVAVLWIVWRMFFGNGSLFTRNKQLHAESHKEDDPSTGDFTTEQLIDKAISEGNYRMATRYLYLQTLDTLGHKEMIALAPQKTNYQYMQELSGKADNAMFSKLTLRYEYAWYGDFKLSPAQFYTIHEEFKTFKNSLSSI